MELIDIDLTAMQEVIVQQGIQAKEGIGGVSLTSRKARLALSVLRHNSKVTSRAANWDR